MAIVPSLSFGRDVQGYNAYAPAPSKIKWKAKLASNIAASFTVPSTHQTWVASFRYYPNNVWVDASGATASVPASGSFVATTSEMNPASLTLQAGTVVSAITEQATADVSVVLWPVSYP